MWTTFDELSSRQAFNNLVIQGLKPPASTFKVITYVTAMEEGIFPRGVSSPEEHVSSARRKLAARTSCDDSQLVGGETGPIRSPTAVPEPP